MLSILFQTVIYPLYALLEIIFRFFYEALRHNIGLTIFVISFLINLFCLPLYINAEKLQKQENDIQKKLKKRVDCIKRNFKGDERHMLLATYYRQNNYHPIMSLRTSLSLLLQIPFFTAAYFFFSHLTLLNGLSLGIIEDLSKPDALFKFHGIAVNVLPVLMTVINLASGAIYSKEQSRKDKIQIWTLALIFLVILYNSPSGLVLYWTFNNLFSLIKNIGLKCAKPLMFLNITLFVAAAGFLIYVFEPKPLHWLLITVGVAYIAFMIYFYQKNKEKFHFNFDALWSADSKGLYFLSCGALLLLVGLVIPSNLIASSPADFSFLDPYTSPLPFLWINIVKSFGIFIFWGWVLYYFSSERVQKILPVVFSGLVFAFICNLLLVPAFHGTMSNTLTYNMVWKESYDIPVILVNNLVNILCFVLTYCCIAKGKTGILKKIMSILIIAFVSAGVINIYKIQSVFNKYSAAVKNNGLIGKKVYSFSKNKKNVLIIMIDRAVGTYLPLIFREKPELKKIYTGFTYYPNTVSYYGHTILAYPALMGGYEYTPLNLNARDKDLMVDKHNESLLLLPLIFKNAGWESTVTDAPWGNYKDVTPYELFTDKGIKYENLKGKIGRFYKSEYLKENVSTATNLSRNLLYFSFMKVAPAALKGFIYDGGKYLNANKKDDGKKLVPFLIESYAGLFYLPQLTDFSSDKPAFIVINNELTHAESFLTYPSYKLTNNPNPGKPLDTDNYSLQHYHLNAAALLLIGDYLKYLKENNVYDNTRIIIVSDHGALFTHNPYLSSEVDARIMNYNPVLFVKDFNAGGEFKTNHDFMTNADTPMIALKNIVNNPKNPFTGKQLYSAEKKNGVYILLNHSEWNPSYFYNDTKPLKDDSRFWYVKDDIFDIDNWSKDMYKLR